MKKYPTVADIEKMKARGESLWKVARAEEQAKRGVQAQELCTIIREAFAGVTLGRGIGLREAQSVDDYEDRATCAAYRKEDEKIDWQRIPAEALNHCNSSLSFFDAEGMRFHLPAYLVAALEGTCDCGVEFSMVALNGYKTAQFSLLSPAQRSAVRAFLLFLLGDCNSKFSRADITQALEQYWQEQA